jgi:hypothetical protein
MAEDIILRLSIEGVEEEVRNVDQLRGVITRLEEQLETADFGSEAFEKATRELKAARGEMYKFERQFEALQDPVKASEKWVKYGEGVAGAFAAAQGAAAIFGVENENVEKMIVKAQGAVAVAMGARMLAESQLLTVLKQSKIATLALDVIEKIRIGTTLASAAATRVLHAAMIAVGIGVVTGLVSVLVANWKNLTEGVKALAKQFVNLVPGMGKVVGLFGRIRDAVVDLGQALNVVASDEEMATKRMAEAAGERADAAAEEFKKRKELAQAAGKDTTAMEERYLKTRLNQLRQAAADGNEERKKEYDDALQELRVFLAAKKKREADAQAADDEAAEQRRKAREEQDERDREAQEEKDEEAKQAEKDAQMASIEQLRKDYDQRIRLAQANGEEAEKVKALEIEAQQTLIAELDKIRATNEEAEARYQDELFNLRVMRAEQTREDQQAERDAEMARVEQLEKHYDERIRLAEAQGMKEEEVKALEIEAQQALVDELNKIRANNVEAEARYNEELLSLRVMRIEKEKRVTDQGAQDLVALEELRASAINELIEATFSSMGTVLGTMDQNSKRTQALQKTLALAQIAYDTGKALSAVIASASTAAAAAGPAGPFMIGPYIAQGLAVVLPGIASAYAALRKAPGGGGGSAPSVSTGNASVPSFTPPDITGGAGVATTDEEEFGGGAPTRAFILSGDVASDMEAREKVSDLARL